MTITLDDLEIDARVVGVHVADGHSVYVTGIRCDSYSGNFEPEKTVVLIRYNQTLCECCGPCPYNEEVALASIPRATRDEIVQEALNKLANFSGQLTEFFYS